MSEECSAQTFQLYPRRGRSAARARLYPAAYGGGPLGADGPARALLGDPSVTRRTTNLGLQLAYILMMLSAIYFRRQIVTSKEAEYETS
ncbi:hypothetical protein NDU88_002938 [Pleurodeles waltl]|uniref:Uncharacterized protein n=1 Tax=Pleurodeles waltl TaxID=8319 RepID=A0AAV7UB65_PLEWA|nr:hypothetical protein NDU88_002938 [Pleurodeles waltl]